MPLLFTNIPILLSTAAGGHFAMETGMSVAIADDTTLGEIDEALRHLSLVPETDRGPAWHAYSDALLEKRANLETDNQ